MNPHLEAALEYAERGWAVFPVHGIVNGRCTCGWTPCSSPGKHPLVRNGVHEATTDTTAIQGWWKQWRLGNVAIATGSVSGVIVIDIDLGRPADTAFGSPGEGKAQSPPDVWDSLERLTPELPRTLTALTGGGGLHLFYTSDDATLGNSAGSVAGIEDKLPGVDLRANGGYVVAPPSMHRSGARYGWLDPGHEPVPAPAWLKRAERPRIEIPRVAPASFAGDGTAYGRAALKSALTSLRHAPVGQRNHTLNRCAFAMAQLIAGGELQQESVRAQLKRVALETGLTERESDLTIASAFSAGLALPRFAPHRGLRTPKPAEA